MRKIFFAASLIFFLTVAFSVSADSVGEKRSFYIDPAYDLKKREELSAVLVKSVSGLYFYADEDWWNFTSQNRIYQALTELEEEFSGNIYPKLSRTFGEEWRPGIDGEEAITVLIHPMKESAGGYFRSNDEYAKVQISNSNQREMIYLNAEHIAGPLAKSFFAHELVHLITFNQKENKNNVIEEVWLNELRAEYAPTLAGYDDNFENSNLEKRASDFKNNPSNSLIDWKSQSSNYSVVNLFGHYLVSHYGLEILIDSLHSPLIGRESINYALKENGFDKTFFDIFVDWIIANLINDCGLGKEYCYLTSGLENFKVNYKVNYLPFSGESALSLSDTTSAWTGNWYKIIGGEGRLKFEFSSSSDVGFKVPYVIVENSGNYKVNFLQINKKSKGQILVSDFGKDISALFVMPIVAETEEERPFYFFSWTASIEKPKENPDLIKELLAKIAQIKAEIAKTQAKIAAILASRNSGKPAPVPASHCSSITANLSYGQNSQQVKCLQEFLKSQGADIYPEGLVTGYFGNLTKLAVIRFQERHSADILAPLGLNAGTGYVGISTRSKINQLINY